MKKYLISLMVLLLTSCNGNDTSPPPSHHTASTCSAQLAICVESCCPSLPQDDTLVDHEIFVLANNPKTKFADWVAYKVTQTNLDGPTRSRVWRQDPKLPPDETLSPSDYRGAYAAHQYDRGHQAPLAIFSNNPNWATTNLLSNLSPQKYSLNRGSFVKLETAVRNLVKQSGDTYVITGTLYEHPMPGLPNASLPHQVPSGYFKIVVQPKAEGLSVAAFEFNQDTPRRDGFCEHRVALSDLKQRLAFDPFPDDQSMTDNLAQQMGCSSN